MKTASPKGEKETWKRRDREDIPHAGEVDADGIQDAPERAKEGPQGILHA